MKKGDIVIGCYMPLKYNHLNGKILTVRETVTRTLISTRTFLKFEELEDSEIGNGICSSFFKLHTNDRKSRIEKLEKMDSKPLPPPSQLIKEGHDPIPRT